MLYLILSAITPVACFLYLIYRRDTQKEPWTRLLVCFVAGIVSFLPAVFIELVLEWFNIFDSLFLSSVYDAFVVAALTEESLKWALLYLLVWRSRDFDQYYDGIVYAVFISMGFACVENVMYVVENGYGVAALRAVLSVPLHGLCGVIMGYFFSLARFSHRRSSGWYILLSLLPAVFAHGLYDFFPMYLMFSGEMPPVLPVLMVPAFAALIIFLWRTGLRKIKAHVERDRTP
jgi:RsiW-degrading membrane proteinase PrsW (M82 family)